MTAVRNLEMTRGLEYRVRPFEERDEAAALALLRESLSSKTSRWDTPTLWRWKHQENPAGQSFTFVAETSEGEIIGIRPMMRWHLRCGQRLIEAVRPVDTVTHPDFRRFGVFTNLNRFALNRLARQGVEVILNTPNRYSLPGYLKAGWVLLGNLRPQLKMVRWPQALFAFVRGQLGQESAKGSYNSQLPSVGDLMKEPGLERLLQEAALLVPNKIQTERSAPYLRWRYERHPSLRYQAVWVKADGGMQGLLVARQSLSHGIKVLVIEELLLARWDLGLGQKLVSTAIDVSGANLVMAYFSPASFQHEVLRRCGFHRHVRGGAHLVTRSLRTGEYPNPLVFGNWGISMGDLEFL